MTNERKQLQKVIELMGEGPARRIRLIIFAVLTISGIALQGLVWWYAVQMASGEWAPWEYRSGLSPLAPGF